MISRMVPSTLLDAWSRHAKAGRRAALFLRHAEREPVVDLRTHERARITEPGRIAAHASGKRLAEIAQHIRVHHSPIERCGETARAIVDGAREAGAKADVVCALEGLGSP